MANLSSRSGRSSQSEKRFQRLAKVRGSPATVALPNGDRRYSNQNIENSCGAEAHSTEKPHNLPVGRMAGRRGTKVVRKKLKDGDRLI
jgi:hypothetical protein